MPFTVNVDPEKKLVESHWEGVASIETLTAYVDQVWTDPKVRGYREFIDFRHVTDVQLASEAVHGIAKYSRMFDNPDRAVRSAVVAPQGLIFGLSRMFSTIRSLEPDDNREFAVFADADEARRWLEQA